MGDAHIDPTREAFEQFKMLPRDQPIWMLNQVRFRDRAEYPAGHADVGLGRSGEDAYREYMRTSGPVFSRAGGLIVWRAVMHAMFIGPAEELWDTVFIARYPSAAAFLAMVTDGEYRRAVVHRQAAVETSRLIRCEQLSAEGLG
ncbi:MAG: DUF1330 domain-containing protein [Proteobacteria bacterium]|nr:DUF1330 domain-containing protein [Pseudomonadota bacterium]